MNGHCRHCSGECTTEDPDGWGALDMHTNGWHGQGADWRTGDCPACEESERIAAAIDKECADAYSPGDGYTYGLAAAAKIARGET